MTVRTVDEYTCNQCGKTAVVTQEYNPPGWLCILQYDTDSSRGLADFCSWTCEVAWSIARASDEE